MAFIVDRSPPRRPKLRRENVWDKLFLVFRKPPKASLPQLEPAELSDHLKRDLGFLDGRG